MGLFGDRDRSRFKTELTTMRLACMQMHRTRSQDQFYKGITSSVHAITVAGRRLVAKGKEAEVRAMLAQPLPEKMAPQARDLLTESLKAIIEGLNRPESDFVKKAPMTEREVDWQVGWYPLAGTNHSVYWNGAGWTDFHEGRELAPSTGQPIPRVTAPAAPGPKEHVPARSPHIDMQQPQAPSPASSATVTNSDAAELAAYRAHHAKALASIMGWKPITVWYAFWTCVFALGAMLSLSDGAVGLSFFGLSIAGALALYVRYLYNGGRRRVWFVIF